ELEVRRTFPRLRPTTDSAAQVIEEDTAGELGVVVSGWRGTGEVRRHRLVQRLHSCSDLLGRHTSHCLRPQRLASPAADPVPTARQGTTILPALLVAAGRARE